MEILRVLNNNVVVARASGGPDFIAMGKGIGFQKKRGDTLNQQQIEKVFTLTDRDLYLHYKGLLQAAEPAVVDLGETIISYANNRFPEKRFNEIIHISLLDHLSGVIDRQQKGYALNNAIWTEVRRVYQDEFSIGLHAVTLMNQRLGYELGNDEAAFIAMHFINAQTDGTPPDVERVSHLISDVIVMVRSYFDFTPDEESLDYYRFIEHIKIMAQCLFSEEPYPETDDGIYHFVAAKYPNINACVDKISYMLSLKHGRNIHNEDKAYLILYIERLLR